MQEIEEELEGRKKQQQHLCRSTSIQPIIYAVLQLG